MAQTFYLLSEFIQKKIWDMRWQSFTDIQERAIPSIINTDKDIILSAGTASGKTEAAFLPIISLVEKEAQESLKVIYISPLKALINNQFERIEKLCEHAYIPVHRWHGDVAQTRKKKLIKNPAGILQITPESIESLFINRTEYLRILFKDIDFIVIDEIHSFIDGERGTHLRSLLSRIEKYCENRPRVIGLSATLNNFKLVKDWVNPNNPEMVHIIDTSGSDKDLLYSLMHYSMGEDRKLPMELFEDMRSLTREMKAIIFANSRGEVEETTVILNKLASKEGEGETYLTHHSSVDKSEREYVEKKMQTTTSPKSVVSTSSLELGIDIGNVDVVVQIDNTFSVSSLKQRLGRSGRKKDSQQILQLYTSKPDALLNSLAVMELVREGWIEPSIGYKKPYDILFHQILSLSKEKNGIPRTEFVNRINEIGIFRELLSERVHQLLKHMKEKDYLEEISGSNELIVGLEGERLMKGKEFYAVFMTEDEYEVLNNTKKIGKVNKNALIEVEDNIILAGKLWKVIDVDSKQSKIYVVKAYDGKPPRYGGSHGGYHKRIGEKMMEILCSSETFKYSNEEAVSVLKDIRKPYHFNMVKSNERVIWSNHEKMIFETFTGTKIANTLTWMLRTLGIKASKPDGLNRIEMSKVKEFEDLFKEIKEKKWDIKELIMVTKEEEMFVSKYFEYLPEDMQVSMHAANEIDIEGVQQYIQDFNFRLTNLA